MLGNLSFTLYEALGYLLPGGVGTLGLLVLYWGLFVPEVPLKCYGYQPGIVAWIAIVLSSYLLGHTMQGLGNILWKRGDESTLSSKRIPPWMRDRAKEFAAKIVGVSTGEMKLMWAFRVLDEYIVQAGKAGDREMFVYREGFYRGSALALFFLATTVLIRGFVPGCAIQLTSSTFPVSLRQILLTTFVIAGTGGVFVQRYRRFAEYRVLRAVIACLIVQHISSKESMTLDPPQG